MIGMWHVKGTGGSENGQFSITNMTLTRRNSKQ
jgi:hypothetical protein